MTNDNYFDLEMLADACIDAEISDAKYESLCISLRAATKAPAPADAQIAMLARKLVEFYPDSLPDLRCDDEPTMRKLIAACRAAGSEKAQAGDLLDWLASCPAGTIRMDWNSFAPSYINWGAGVALQDAIAIARGRAAPTPPGEEKT